MKVFISYAMKDLDSFRIPEVADFLEFQDDIERVFYWDRDCDSNQSIIKYMENSIQDCEKIIFVCSENTKDSASIQQELEMATYSHKSMIPVFRDLEDVTLILRPKKGIRFEDINFQGFLEKLYFNLTRKKAKLKRKPVKINGEIEQSEKIEKIEPQITRGKEEKVRRIIDFRGTKIPQSQVDIIQVLENGLRGKFRLVHEIGNDGWEFTVENKLITGICLNFCWLSTVSKSIGNLHSLQRLYLVHNRLTELPETIGNLRSLQILKLENNILTELPETIGNLRSLQILKLGTNKLTALPETIGTLHSLQILKLNDNNLTKLPESIGTLQSLKELDLECNELTNLPESIGELHSLQILNLEDNKLVTLPDTIGTLQSLEQLKLWNNQLTTLPKSIGTLQSLKEIELSGNDELTVLPESIGELQSLQKLSITKMLASNPEVKSLLKRLKSNGVKIRKS